MVSSCTFSFPYLNVSKCVTVTAPYVLPRPLLRLPLKHAVRRHSDGPRVRAGHCACANANQSLRKSKDLRNLFQNKKILKAFFHLFIY